MQFSLRGVVEKFGNLPMNKIAIILKDVCLGLQYLHTRAQSIVHRDLTPNNIMLCCHLRAKITDLGLARTLQATDAKTLTKAPGTLDFMAPECLADAPAYGLAIDIFSFGGVILYIGTQQWPHPAPWVRLDPDSGEKLILTSEVQRRQQYLDIMAEAYTDLKPLVVSCLDDNPKNRPTVTKMLTEIKVLTKKFSNNNYCDIDKFNSQLQQQKEQLQPAAGVKQHQQPLLEQQQQHQGKEQQSHQLQQPQQNYQEGLEQEQQHQKLMDQQKEQELETMLVQDEQQSLQVAKTCVYVCVCMYSLYVCMDVHMYVYMYICEYMYKYVPVCTYVCRHILMHVGAILWYIWR